MIPTTHIFKPATGSFDGYAENEHFCIALAKELGMPVASSVIRYFGATAVIVVERYDRVRDGTRVMRVHQEDMCQALARMPQVKYQNQGGPSPREIIGLIREHSTSRAEDEARFVDSIIFNWLISGTDAHAKNYSFLIAPWGQVRLAPLYDLSSALPYARQIAPRDATLAMKVGSKYRLATIGAHDWEKFAAELRIEFGVLRNRILHLANAMPGSARKVGEEIKKEGITHDVIKRLIELLKVRALHCGIAMGS
jgi:serine/threonine-protein kinase HipA